MKSADTTRRMFLGGAASTAAVLGPLAVVGVVSSGKNAGQRNLLSPTQLAGKNGGVSEMERWSALVGMRVTVSSGTAQTGGTLAYAKPLPALGARPKGIRQQPMALSFTLDQAIAGSDAVFAVAFGTGMKADLFMQPGVTSKGAPQLFALLN